MSIASCNNGGPGEIQALVAGNGKKQNRDSGFTEKMEVQRIQLLNLEEEKEKLERQWREEKEKLEKMEEETRRVKFRYVMGGTKVMQDAEIPSIIAEVQNESSINALTEYIQNSQSSAADATLTIRLSTDSIEVRGCIFRDYFHMQPRMEIVAQFRDGGKYVSEQQLIKECEEKEFTWHKNYKAPYEGKRGFNASEIQMRLCSCFQQPDAEGDIFHRNGFTNEELNAKLREVEIDDPQDLLFCDEADMKELIEELGLKRKLKGKLKKMIQFMKDAYAEKKAKLSDQKNEEENDPSAITVLPENNMSSLKKPAHPASSTNSIKKEDLEEAKEEEDDGVNVPVVENAEENSSSKDVKMMNEEPAAYVPPYLRNKKAGATPEAKEEPEFSECFSPRMSSASDTSWGQRENNRQRQPRSNNRFQGMFDGFQGSGYNGRKRSGGGSNHSSYSRSLNSSGSSDAGYGGGRNNIQRRAQMELDTFPNPQLERELFGEQQNFMEVQENRKIDELLDLLPNCEGLKLVFTATKRGANQVEYLLNSEGCRATCIHGDKTQTQRERALKDFRRGNVDTLVATDIAARGLDIPNVMWVIQYDLPSTIDDYVHRIGRTGRCGNEGTAVSFVNRNNWNVLGDLLDFLKESKQDVPTWLGQLRNETRRSSKGRKKGRYGGRDFRRGQSSRKHNGGHGRNNGGYGGNNRRGYDPYENNG